MSDLVEGVFPSGSPVAKESVRAWETTRSILIVSTSEVPGLSLAGRSHLVADGSLWLYDADDVTSAHDGITIMVSAEGRRYRNQGSITRMGGAAFMDALPVGSIPASRIGGGDDGTILVRADGETAWVDPIDVAALIDSALGSDDWRGGPSSMTFASVVSHLAGNAWRGLIGGRGRVVQMADGRLRAGGAATSGYNGRVDGANIGFLTQLGFPTGTVIADGKFWLGSHAGYCVDTSGWPWSWGDGSQGALGHGDTTTRPVPKQIAWFVVNGFRVREIVPVMTGDDAGCMGAYFLEDGGTGRVAYAGRHDVGAAGDGSAASGIKVEPVLVGGAASPLTSVTYLACSGHPTTTLARRADGSWRGWGANTSSCLGISGSNFTTPQPLTAMQDWSKAVCGGAVTLALTSGGGARTAGRNASGELGIGSTTATSGWQTPTGLSTGVIDIAIGDRDATTLGAIVDTTGLGNRVARFWGNDDVGQCGGGSTGTRTSPYEPVGVWQGKVGRIVIAAATGQGCSTFVASGEQIWAAGKNDVYQLSIGIAGNVAIHSAVLGIVGRIVDWSVTGYGWSYGLTVLTDRGAFSGGVNDLYDAVIGPTAGNQGILSEIFTVAMVGAKGDIGLPGPAGPIGPGGLPGFYAALPAALRNEMDGYFPGMVCDFGRNQMIIDGGSISISGVLTVSSGSKRVIGATGVLETVAANQPAYDWSTGRRRLLIEAAATNYLGYGQSPGATGWTVRGTAAVVTGVSDPAGGTTATRLTVGAIYTNDLYRPVTGGGASTRHEPSVFIRRVSTTGTILVQNTAGSGYGYWTVDMALLPDGWVRLTRSLAAVTVGQEFTTDASNACGLWFASTGASSVTFETFAGQIEKGVASTSPILATGAAAVTRIADDVRPTASALAQVTGAGGCTIVLRGSLVGADWIMGGAVNGAMIHAANGTIRSDSGEFIRPSGWASSLLANFGIALGCAPTQRKIAINGSPVATSGTNALWGVADETSMRIGSSIAGVSACAAMWIDEIVIWPFVGSNAGLQSHARVWS